MGNKHIAAGALLVAALVLAGCTPAADPREAARAAVDVVLQTGALGNADQYDEIADGIVDEALRLCDDSTGTSGWRAGAESTPEVVEAFDAAQAAGC
jgi:hypothetical protein